MFTMAPAALQPHFCLHCQNNVVDINCRGRYRDHGDMATKGSLFDCTFKDVKLEQRLDVTFVHGLWMMNSYHAKVSSVTVQKTFPPMTPTRRYWMHCRI